MVLFLGRYMTITSMYLLCVKILRSILSTSPANMSSEVPSHGKPALVEGHYVIGGGGQRYMGGQLSFCAPSDKAVTILRDLMIRVGMKSPVILHQMPPFYSQFDFLFGGVGGGGSDGSLTPLLLGNTTKILSNNSCCFSSKLTSHSISRWQKVVHQVYMKTKRSCLYRKIIYIICS